MIYERRGNPKGGPFFMSFMADDVCNVLLIYIWKN